jgi:hypothetical protein
MGSSSNLSTTMSILCVRSPTGKRAVYSATARRIPDLPITPEKLL